MILLLDTSSYEANLYLVDETGTKHIAWQADRELAKGLLGWLNKELVAKGLSWKDVRGLGIYCGPGSFTGLRIGITVMNTLAESLRIPIVGSNGEDWRTDAMARLRAGENETLILPYYDRDAIITKQRK